MRIKHDDMTGNGAYGFDSSARTRIKYNITQRSVLTNDH